MQNTYTPDFMDLATLPGMDFLNLANPANTSASTSEDLNYDFSSGLDTGFGVGNAGLDFHDGQHYDLFDGFFFGSNTISGSGAS